jgi:hypothetical protein
MRKAGAWIVVSGCVYETVAIMSGRIPTITHMSWKLRKNHVGKVVLWGALGLLAWHLFVDEE